ncbi:MAG: hypothetical protein J6A15_02955 [Clostridia bacterium]|nr:hypothetical protein [Clostridia bacterium]
MEIAALVCNDKLNYESTFQIYSMFEYLKDKGNQIQIIDYNLLDRNQKSFGLKKKNNLLYNFLDNNVILTSIRYKTVEQIEDNPPLADKYIIANATYNDLNLATSNGDYYAYGVRDINNDQLNCIKDKYKDISTLFEINGSEVKKVVDPMFLLPKEDWYDFALHSNIKIENDNYTLVYSEVVTQDMLKYAKNLSEKNNAKIYIVADKVETLFYKGRRIYNALPYDLANLVLNAQEVVTSCDDGIKLSIIFEKGLHIFNDVDNVEQIELINEFNLVDRIVDSTDRLVTSHFNYSNSLAKIEELKNNVESFL